MKTLIITRHAKSDWSNLYLPDYDRELNHRGLTDAPMMGARLKERGINIDLLVSSTAKRAAQTAQLIASSADYDEESIQWIEKLYHAPASFIEEVIVETQDAIETLLIVCHNPGVTHFVNSIAGHLVADMPTCGMAAFTLEATSWKNFKLTKADLLFYDFPKNGLN